MQFSRTKPLADDLSMRDGVVDMREIKLFITESQWCDIRDSRLKDANLCAALTLSNGT